MQHRRIGNTDLEVSTIGFGTWEMSMNYGENDGVEMRLLFDRRDLPGLGRDPR